MLGWHINIYRQSGERMSPANAEAALGILLFSWRAGIGGLDWISPLVAAGHAIDLGGNGYPFRYTANAQFILDLLAGGLPSHLGIAASRSKEGGSELTHSKREPDLQAMAECSDEWIVIEAWDES